MMNKRNYQRELDALLTEIEKEHKIPRLFLHSCCAPCSSYVLEYLSEYFEITVFFYNPNISLEEEYRKRVEEIKRLVREMKFAIRSISRKEAMPRRFFMRGSKVWRSFRKAESAALNAIVSAWRRQQKLPETAAMIISRPRSPSVRSRMHRKLMRLGKNWQKPMG